MYVQETYFFDLDDNTYNNNFVLTFLTMNQCVNSSNSSRKKTATKKESNIYL